jgi:hypothetical protein
MCDPTLCRTNIVVEGYSEQLSTLASSIRLVVFFSYARTFFLRILLNEIKLFLNFLFSALSAGLLDCIRINIFFYRIHWT